jgi:hypothetical protein
MSQRQRKTRRHTGQKYLLRKQSEDHTGDFEEVCLLCASGIKIILEKAKAST